MHRIFCPEIPGLDPNDEVELVEVDPDPSNDSYVWSHALQVEGLPQVNVGQPTAEFLEDAARVGMTRRTISVSVMPQGAEDAPSRIRNTLRSAD